MYVQSISTTVEKIPLKTPFITALRRVDTVEFVRVKVVCKNGSISFGEAPATKAITGEDLATIIKAIQLHKTKIIGLSVHESLEVLHTLEMGSSAKAAIDMALYNFINPMQKVIELNTAITISFDTEAMMLKSANIACENEHSILKLKFAKDIDHAITVSKKIISQNPEAKILVDANQAWSYPDTIKYIDALKNFKIELIEQPVKKDELDLLKKITEYSSIPIVADESCFNLNEIKQIVQTKGADIINIKLMKCGGVTKAIEILEYCRSQNIPVMMGSMLEGPISIAYASNLVDTYKDVVKYIDLDSPLLYKKES